VAFDVFSQKVEEANRRNQTIQTWNCTFFKNEFLNKNVNMRNENIFEAVIKTQLSEKVKELFNFNSNL
jgi:hypothetical protein